MDSKTENSKPVVMVVDDEPMVLEVSSLMIESLGNAIESYLSPSEALEAFKNNPEHYDLIVIDMVMPNLSGKELFIKLKEIRPDVRAVISSGYQLNESNNELLELGIKGFISKPFTIDNLKDTLSSVMSQSISA